MHGVARSRGSVDLRVILANWSLVSEWLQWSPCPLACMIMIECDSLPCSTHMHPSIYIYSVAECISPTGASIINACVYLIVACYHSKILPDYLGNYMKPHGCGGLFMLGALKFIYIQT